MAWSLQFDGVNDSLTMTSWAATGDFTISGAVELTGVAGSWLGAGGNDTLLGEEADGDIILRVAGGTIFFVDIGAASGVITYSISRVGSTVSYTIAGVSSSFTQAGTVDVTTIGIRGASGGAPFYSGQMSGQLILNRTGDVRTYDFDASSHAAGTVVVTDTSSAQNATGVSMPTDGSAWVEVVGAGPPAGSRSSINKIADYLRSTGTYTHFQTNDIVVEWLLAEGETGNLNGMLHSY